MNKIEIKTIAKAIGDKKGISPVALDVAELTTLGDVFFITSASSQPQMKAIAEEVIEKMAKIEQRPLRIEGMGGNTWILIDFGDFIVHIFSNEARDFYGLEHLWADAKKIDISEEI